MRDGSQPAARMAWLAMVVSGLLLAGCGGAVSSAPSGPAATSSSAPAPTASVVATTEPPAVATPTPAPKPVIHARIPVGDQQILTVMLAEEWPGTGSVVPAAASIFVTIQVHVDGVVSTTVAAADFKAIDGVGHNYGPQAPGREPAIPATSDLAAGASVEGFLTFQVPKDVGLLDLTLTYAPASAPPIDVRLH